MTRRLSEMADLTGRTVLLTGGAGHIGLVSGEALVELGARVLVADRDEGACAKRAEYLGGHAKGSASPLAVDLLDEEATRRAVRRAVREFGGLDAVVHSAAYVGATDRPGWAAPFGEQTVQAWDEAMRVNVTSAFVIAQEASEALRRSGRGSIILFSSIYGMEGPDMRLYEGTRMANPTGYGVSKGGVLQLMRYLATQLAPSVRVNAISPGGVYRGQPDGFRERYEARTPLGRMAAEEDVKGAVAYLASDLSSYVTGHNLVVDGGWTVW